MGLSMLVLSVPLRADAAAADRVPAYVIELPASTADIFIADTSRSTLMHYAHADGELTLAGEGYMSIGENGPGKQRAWDRRTPLGVYFVVDQIDTGRLPDKYGVTAFPLDYPNEWDRQNRRTGDGIWVHGVQRGPDRRPAFDTDGCIALPNEDLSQLEARFVPLSTPVIVTREVAYIGRDEAARLRGELRAALAAWRDSVMSGNLYAYLSLYAGDFDYRGMDEADWAALRHRNFGRSRPAGLRLDDVYLLADPEVEGLFVSRFRQTAVQDGRTKTLLKRLYWRRGEDGVLRIVAEDNG